VVDKGRVLFRFGPFELDRTARVLFRGTEPVPLAPRTVDTLIVLLESPGQVRTKEELMAAIWPDRAVEEVNLTQQISLLRKALAAQDNSTEYIRNFPGRGYQFIVPVEQPRDLPVPASQRWRGWAIAAGLCVVAVAAALWLALPSQTPDQAPALRRIPLSRLPGSKSHPALSPDGAKVAFVWNKEDGTGPCIYVKAEGREEPDLLRGTCGNPSSPVWSPDGRRMAYFRNLPGGSELAVLGELGQDRVLKRFYPLRSLIGNRLLAWSPDGKWIAACGKEEAKQPLTVHLISPEGGPGRVLTRPDAALIGDADPAFSPDSQTVAFVRMSSRFNMQLELVPVAGGPSRTIVAGDQLIGGVAWSHDGREVIFSANRAGGYRLWRIRPEAGPGEPFPDPSQIAGDNPIHLSLAHSPGRLAYVVTGEDLNIWRLRVRGKPEWSRVIASTGMDAAPQYSPDGSKICFLSDRSGEEHIWVANADGSEPRQLTHRRMSPGHCSWSADNNSVLFVAHGSGVGGIFSVPAAGGDPKRVPLVGDGSLPVMSPDGRTLYVARQSGGRYELFSARLHDGQAVQLTRTGAHRARVSRDGSWVYYVQARTSSFIWRISPAGERNERVVDGLIPGYFGAWALAPNGIYYLGEDPASQRPAILFHDLDLRKSSPVAPLPSAPPPLGLTEFSLSPDGGTLLAVLRDSASSDLLALSNFR
jgi:Tol biopolymer transport system component/DNA-binding winged helix-turn-helix (wHTH) protein